MTTLTEKLPVSDTDRAICEVLGLEPIAWEDLEASRLEMVRQLREKDGVSLEDDNPDAYECDLDCSHCDVTCSLN